jgi:hypothetical protein
MPQYVPQNVIQQQTGHGQPKRKSIFADARFWIGLIAGVVIGALLLFGAEYIYYRQTTVEAQNNVLATAYNDCHIKATEQLDNLKIADNNQTLTLGSGSNGMETFDCLVKSMGIPESVQTKVGATTGMSGTQEDSFGNVKITWSYSGNNGLSMVFETQQ